MDSTTLAIEVVGSVVFKCGVGIFGVVDVLTLCSIEIAILLILVVCCCRYGINNIDNFNTNNVSVCLNVIFIFVCFGCMEMLYV